MSEPLWSWDKLVAALGATVDGDAPEGVTGISIDTRTLQTRDLFVALKDIRDGHDFVPAAFQAGAAAAIVAKTYQRQSSDGALLRVDDPLKALEALCQAARQRLSADAHVIAVTGSVGKTGTKEMLRAACQALGTTHAAEKSYNNHWGVPLTLARMPADTKFGVFEIGMNHAGEITPLVAMVRPHVAIVTTVEPVHLEFFDSVADIAHAKAEIFSGLIPGGAAIINRDNPYADILETAAKAAGARIVMFGEDELSDIRAAKITLGPQSTKALVRYDSLEREIEIGIPGVHVAKNALAVFAALNALDLDLDRALPALGDIQATAGRGARMRFQASDGRDILVIDESYNANPASMRAALAALGAVPRADFSRRIAVLGDMLELGASSGQLHTELKTALESADVDLVFASGPNMRLLYEALPQSRQGGWAEASSGIAIQLCQAVKGGDAVMIKGSLGSRMGPLVVALKETHGG